LCVCVCCPGMMFLEIASEKRSFPFRSLCMLCVFWGDWLWHNWWSIGKGRNLSDLKRVLWSGTGTIHQKKPWEWDLRERTISFWRS
jgi:hypothetical protein